MCRVIKWNVYKKVVDKNSIEEYNKNSYTTSHHDSVAQLGERYLDRVEVAGSNPVGIIIPIVSRVERCF